MHPTIGCRKMGPSFKKNLKNKCQSRAILLLELTTIATFLLLIISLGLAHGDSTNPQTAVISSRAAFLRAQRASRQLRQELAANQSTTAPTSSSTSTTTSTTSSTTTSSTTTSSSTTTTTTTTPAPPRPQSSPASSASPVPVARVSNTSNSVAAKPRLFSPSGTRRDAEQGLAARTTGGTSVAFASSSGNQSNVGNRTTRTADVSPAGESFISSVTNTCERDQMLVNIKLKSPFYGVVHTRNQRQKSACTIEGNGATEYNMVISHALNPSDPNHCGVIKARRESPEDRDLLSVVVVVRVSRDIELSNDRFFLLNCTNRCKRPDCSSPSSGNLLAQANPTNGRVIADEIPDAGAGERESITTPTTNNADQATGADRSSSTRQDGRQGQQDEECTIWKFPWLITLLWCMGILLLAMIISHCIMCSSLVCRCVRTEVEERAPSVYEDDETDDEDRLYNKKNHPMRIDYDNRDIYKTSNNYEPYCLDESQGRTNRTRPTEPKSRSAGRR